MPSNYPRCAQLIALDTSDEWVANWTIWVWCGATRKHPTRSCVGREGDAGHARGTAGAELESQQVGGLCAGQGGRVMQGTHVAQPAPNLRASRLVVSVPDSPVPAGVTRGRSMGLCCAGSNVEDTAPHVGNMEGHAMGPAMSHSLLYPHGYTELSDS